MIRDRLGRLHCDCGGIMSKQTLESDDPNEKPEDFYVCLKYAREGEDVFISVEEADKEYPDWNKSWREEMKRRYGKKAKA